MLSLLVADSVSAQRFRHGGYSPRVVVSGGLYPYYGLGIGPEVFIHTHFIQIVTVITAPQK